MARQVLPIVGAAVGAYFGGPAGAQLGYMIGSIVGNAVDPQIIKGPSIGDGVLQTSKEGVPRPIVYGTGCIAGNVFDRGEIRKWKKRTRQGKGGPVNEEERMSLTFAIRICEGPIAGILRIWEDEKLVYDIRPESEIKEDSTRYGAKFRFYNGSETQLPDPALEAIREPGKTPSYRGTAYIVFEDLDVTDRRGSVPSFRFEVVSENTSSRRAVVSTASSVFELNEENNLVITDDIDWGFYEPNILQAGLGARMRPDDAFSLSYDSQYVAAVAADPFGGDNLLLAKRKVDDAWVDCTVASLPSQPLRATFSPARNFLAVLCEEHLVLLNADGSEFFLLEQQPHGKVFLTDTSTGTTVQQLAGQSKLVFKWDGSMLAFLGVELDGGSFPVGHVWMGRIRVVESGFDPGEYVLTREVFTSSTFLSDVKEDFSLSQSWDDRNDVVYWTGDYSGPLNPNSGPTIRGIDAGVSLTNSVYSDEDFSIGKGRHCFFLPDGSVGVIGPSVSESGVSLYRLPTEFSSNNRVFTGTKTLLWSSNLLPSSTIQEVRMIRESTGSSYLIAFVAGSGDTSYNLTLLQFSSGGEVTQLGSSIHSSPQAGLGFVAGQTSLEAGKALLGNIIRDVTLRSKVDVDALDLVDVENTVVRGYIVAGAYNANNVLRSLQDTFLFDPADWDKKIHFVSRGKPVVAVLDEDALVDDPTEETRENAREYPRKMELFYQNPDVGYAAAKAVAERVSQDYDLSGTTSMESPVTLIVDEAWQLADKQLKILWEEARGEVVLRVNAEFDFLSPTDCIGFYRRGVGSRLRIHKIDKADGVLTLTCRHDRQSAYTSDVVGLPVIPPTKPPSSITGETLFQFLNIPALVDNVDPLLHYYYGATGTSDAWYGAIIERSVDDDDFSEVSRTSFPARMGQLIDPLPFSSEYFPDTTNSFVVEMFRNDDILESVSESQLLREQNGAALSRPDGTAELIQFRDVEDLGERKFRISYILRSRLNSGADAHPAGTIFTFLDDVVAVTAGSALMGATLNHRPTSFNESPESSDVYTDTWSPVLSQTEFPVDQLLANRDGDVVSVSWSPRERFGTDVNPIRSVNWTSYRATATDGTFSQTVDVLTPYVNMTVAGWASPISVSVSQVNRITGPGPSVTVQAS